MRRELIVLLSCLLLGPLGCQSHQGSRADPPANRDPRFAALTHCAQRIGVAEGFTVSTSSGTLLERQVGDMRVEVKELRWLGSYRSGDSLHAAAHVQLTSSGARRTTIDQLSPAAQRVVQRINRDCAVGPTVP